MLDGMKQDFATRELKNTVESFYGVKLRSLRKIATGAQSVNFWGVVDGLGVSRMPSGLSPTAGVFAR